MFVRTEDGALKDVELTAVTKDNYIVPDNEKGFFHVIMENKQYDPKGVKVSLPRLQKFKAATFKKLRQNFERQGYTLDILHDPTAYLAEVGDNAKKIKENAEKERINAAVKKALAEQEATMQERIDAAVKAALAERPKREKKTE